MAIVFHLDDGSHYTCERDQVVVTADGLRTVGQLAVGDQIRMRARRPARPSVLRRGPVYCAVLLVYPARKGARVAAKG